MPIQECLPQSVCNPGMSKPAPGTVPRLDCVGIVTRCCETGAVWDGELALMSPQVPVSLQCIYQKGSSDRGGSRDVKRGCMLGITPGP